MNSATLGIKRCNYFVDVRVLPYFLEADTPLKTKNLLLRHSPLSITEGNGNDGEYFWMAEFSLRSQAMRCFSSCQLDALLSINTKVLAFHDGKIQSVWNQPEKRIIRQLKAKLGGKSEASTPVGRIDLLTENQLIEVKPRINWKSGLGQLLAYSSFYPQHNLILYLFECTERQALKNTDRIIKLCQSANIKPVFILDLGFDYNSDVCAVEVSND